MISASLAIMETQESETDEDIPVLPICDKKTIIRENHPDILFVSTLDGTLTALDAKNGGKTLWSVGTGPGSMLSSTISQVELTSNAQFVRLIPSLAGGLYKFDGEVIEPVPLNAEDLLRTSFKFADNTVMTGGKESRVYGIEVKTGKIRYECTMAGCFSPTGEALSSKETDLEDIVIVKRETQVVRAIEPRTGSEKWNFSVSTHHLTFQPGLEDVCNNTDEEEIIFDDFEELKAVVPEGIICQVDKDRPEIVKWKQTLNSPIVHAWRLERGQLIPINLFSNSHLPNPATTESPIDVGSKNDPSLYIGSYKQQLYVQESDWHLNRKIHAEANGQLDNWPKLAWKPYLISADSRTTIINHGTQPSQTELPMLTYDPSTAESTALAVKYQGGNAEYPYDSGLYFYPEEANLEYNLIEDMRNNITGAKKGSESKVNTADESKKEEEEGVLEEIANPVEPEMPSEAIQIVFVSMWYWWQEIVLISLVTAAVMNLLITRPYIQGMREGFRRRIDQITRGRPVLVVERRVEVPYEVQVEVPVPKTPDTGSSEMTNLNFSRSASTNSGSNGPFVSRYLTDYEPVQCLGAGGFGVVFESKNKLDEIHYAVKRVRLPSHEEAKKKVMREVKCLAKLDQRNIVRYYSTWLEYPPQGWQEDVDKVLKEEGKFVKTEDAPDSLSMYDEPSCTSGVSTNNPLKPFDNPPRSSTDLSKNYNDHDEDSFRVVFEVPSEDEEVSDSESDGGIVFKDDTPDPQILQKPAPSRSISIVSMTNSKFWKEISEEVEEETDDPDCQDALVWDNKNHKPPSVYLYIVMQLCQKESLRTWLRNNSGPRNRLQCLSMFNEICTGVEYVHNQDVIHRDLKPSNIFFANDGTIKLGDFGLATAGNNPEDLSDIQSVNNDDYLGDNYEENEKHTEEVGTELYMSPEQLAKKPYNNKVDIYSLGLILYELLVPFSTQMERIHTLTKLRQLEFPAKFKETPEYSLVKTMLDHDPSERPESTAILDMEFLSQAVIEYENQTNAGAMGDVGGLYSSAASQRQRRKHLSSGGSNHSSQ